MNCCYRKTFGYHIEKDDYMSSKMDEHDFEQSISSQISRDITSASETEVRYYQEFIIYT